MPLCPSMCSWTRALVCVELLGLDRWRVHHDVAQVVDVILRGMGEVVECEIRQDKGLLSVTCGAFLDESAHLYLPGLRLKMRTRFVVSRFATEGRRAKIGR